MEGSGNGGGGGGRCENQNEPSLMRLEADSGDMLVPGQLYLLLSVIGPAKCVGKDGRQEDFFAVKFRGAFANVADAKAHMQKLAKSDKYYDVFLAEAGKWLTLPPDGIEDVTYHEEKLNAIFSNYKSEAVKQKEAFEHRQEEMIRQAMDKMSKLETEAAKLAAGEEAKEEEEEKKAEEETEGVSGSSQC